MTIQEWVKANATLKDTAKVEELDGLVKDLDPLANIKTKEDALNFIDRNNLFKSGLDSAISKAVASNTEKFTAEKLPGLLKEEREKAIKEANPEETPEQKRIRELEEKINASDKREASSTLKIELAAKAKEIGYEGSIERYSRLSSEKALEYLVSDHEENTKKIESIIESTKKEFYGEGTLPKKSETPPGKYNVNDLKGKSVDEIRQLQADNLIVGM